MTWVASEPCQSTLFVDSGGQPASRAAWHDRRLDDLAGRFFSSTRSSLDAAYVRPNDPWFAGLQAEGGTILQRYLRGETREIEAMDHLELEWARARQAGVLA